MQEKMLQKMWLQKEILEIEIASRFMNVVEGVPANETLTLLKLASFTLYSLVLICCMCLTLYVYLNVYALFIITLFFMNHSSIST